MFNQPSHTSEDGFTSAARPTRLVAIQALRGLAALAVVIYHAARHLAQATDIGVIKTLSQPGHVGVDVFFVLSGFIIFYVHRSDINRPQAMGRYIRQRFVRVVPIYWVALAATIALLSYNHMDEITVSAVIGSATLVPIPTEPLLGVAWTLQHEVLFYTLFALAILSRKLAVTVLALWLILMAAAFIGAIPEGTAAQISRVTSLYNVQFLFGIAAALVVTSDHLRYSAMTALAGGALLVAAGAAEALGQLDGYGDGARLIYGIAAAMLIAGLSALELKKPRRVPRLLVQLGEASYSLYLFHLIAIGVAWQIWLRSGIGTDANVTLCFLFLTISAVVGGMVAHLFIERPVLRRVRAWLANNATGAQTAKRR